MTLRWRVGVLLAIAASGTAGLAVVRHFAVNLVETVVEHSLVQKSEGVGVDPAVIRLRLRRHLSGLPGKEERLSRLFEMARVLEKVQQLDRMELQRLLP